MEKPPCSVEGCIEPVHIKGWCNKHYQRWRRYGDPLGGKPRYETCTIEDCQDQHYARGWCKNHYRRWKMHGDPLGGRPRNQPQPDACSVEGCARAAATHTFCGAHFARWKRHGDPLGGQPQMREPLPEHCAVEGCPKPPAARGWCYAHYERWHRYGDPLAPLRRARNGEGWRGLNNDGYVVIKHGAKTQLEHRLVMEQILGRKLLPTETVHHKNTIKTDNAPSNLELWDTSQPKGGRVEDKIEWALELLSRYGEVDFRRLR